MSPRFTPDANAPNARSPSARAPNRASNAACTRQRCFHRTFGRREFGEVKPSPVSLTMRPRCAVTSGSMTSARALRHRGDTPASSRSMSRAVARDIRSQHGRQSLRIGRSTRSADTASGSRWRTIASALVPAPYYARKVRVAGFGGAEGDRTLDLRIANAALSQLSYCPTGRGLSASWNGARKPALRIK